MPEEKTIPAVGEGADNSGADNSAGAGEGQDKGADIKPIANEKDTGKEDAGKGEGEGADPKDVKGQEGQEKSAKAPQGEGSQKEGEDDDDKLEPETRKRLSPQDFIIGRQKAKLAKKAKASEGEGEDNKDEDDGVAKRIRI